MKKNIRLPVVIFSSFIMMIIVFSCGSSTTITGTWERQEIPRDYNNVLVAALTPQTGIKATIENEMAQNLSEVGVEASQSIEVLPPKFSDDDNQKQRVLDAIQTNEVDAILTVTVIDEETETRYSPGAASYAPYPAFDFYGNFWGYYSHWYPRFDSPGYYSEDKIYFIETNLYDADTEDLIWSAQSETYNPADIETFSEDFAEEIVEQLTEDGIL
ncbi:MAG: hypothetical protein ACOC10_02830 [Bacteroidota bacterium]